MHGDTFQQLHSTHQPWQSLHFIEMTFSWELLSVNLVLQKLQCNIVEILFPKTIIIPAHLLYKIQTTAYQKSKNQLILTTGKLLVSHHNDFIVEIIIMTSLVLLDCMHFCTAACLHFTVHVLVYINKALIAI